MVKPRIVSLCPSNTELVNALGLCDCLVGVDNYSDCPADKLSGAMRLGPDLHIDIEKTAQLKPDLVICSLSVPGMEKVVEGVAQANLPYIVLSPHSIEDIFHDFTILETALHGYVPKADVELQIASLRARVERIRERTEGLEERPKLYWEWWPKPVFSPAKRNWLTEVSQLAGAQNIFADVDGDQVQDDGSRVIARNPEYFLAVWTGVPQHKVPMSKIQNRVGWEVIRAFVEHNMYILSEGLFCRPSPRLIDGLEQLTSLLHPELARQLHLPPLEFHAPVRTFK